MQARIPHPYTTPLAAPPPPLNLLPSNQGRGNADLPAFAGARHTLGPTFSEEEDGDDSQFIAEKMAHLGLDRLEISRGGRRHENDRRPYTPPSQGSRRTRKRQAEYEAYLASMHSGGRDQNISPPIPNGHRHGQNWNQRSQHELLKHQEAYVSLQHQAQLALLAAQIHQNHQHHHQTGINHKKQDQYYQPQPQPQHQHQQHMTIQQQQQRLFALHQQPQPQPQAHAAQDYASPSDQRERLAAQVQANLLARTRRQKNLDDAETRARFESIPNTNPTTNLRSPFGVENTARVSPFARPDSMWSANSVQTENNTSAFGQFSRPQITAPATQQQPVPKPSQGNSLSALLSRRGQVTTPSELNEKPTTKPEVPPAASADSSRVTSTTTTAQVSPVSVTSSKGDDKEKQVQVPESTALRSLGLGRPKTHFSNLFVNRPVRAWSTPSGATTSATATVPTPRSVSQPTTAVHTVRQPFGPPGNIDKLKEENFKSLLRKRAGLKLGMLNRRVSPTMPVATLEEE